MIVPCGKSKDTPQKSKIDTKNGHTLKESPVFKPWFWVSMLAFGDVVISRWVVIFFGRVKAKAKVSYTLLSKSLLRGVPWRKKGSLFMGELKDKCRVLILAEFSDWRWCPRENKSSAPLHFWNFLIFFMEVTNVWIMPYAWLTNYPCLVNFKPRANKVEQESCSPQTFWTIAGTYL